MIELVIAVVFTVIAFGYLWLKQRSLFWEKRQIPLLRPESLFLGNTSVMFWETSSVAENIQRLYNDLVPYLLFLQTPILLVRGPELHIIKTILVKDFLNEFRISPPGIWGFGENVNTAELMRCQITFQCHSGRTRPAIATLSLPRWKKMERIVNISTPPLLCWYNGFSFENIAEVSRLYPVVPLLQRICVEDYRFTDSNFIMKKGEMLFIPSYGLHRDAQYFPDPDVFNQENFL